LARASAWEHSDRDRAPAPTQLANSSCSGGEPTGACGRPDTRAAVGTAQLTSTWERWDPDPASLWIRAANSSCSGRARTEACGRASTPAGSGTGPSTPTSARWDRDRAPAPTRPVNSSSSRRAPTAIFGTAVFGRPLERLGQPRYGDLGSGPGVAVDPGGEQVRLLAGHRKQPLGGLVLASFVATGEIRPPLRPLDRAIPTVRGGRRAAVGEDQLDLRGRTHRQAAMPARRPAHPVHARDARGVARDTLAGEALPLCAPRRCQAAADPGSTSNCGLRGWE